MLSFWDFSLGCGNPVSTSSKIDAIQNLPRELTTNVPHIDRREIKDRNLTVKTLGSAAHSKKFNFPQSSHTSSGKYSPISLREDFSPGCGKPISTSSKIGVFDGKNEKQEVVWSPKQSAFSEDSKANKSRKQVEEVLKLHRKSFAAQQREQIAKAGKRNSTTGRKVAMKLEMEGKWVNKCKRIGAVPGVEIGDVFYSAAEMNVIGLHHQYQSGIDFLKGLDGKLYATSILVSGRYDNDMKSTDSFTYTGQGGNPWVGRVEPKDQKLTRGNLALKNSLEARKPVRVIRGFKWSSESLYIYCGLGKFGKLVFRFSFERILGQPKLTLEAVSKLRKSKPQKNISSVNDISQGKKKIPTRVVNADISCVNDISQGKEKIPIRVVNAKDDERPPFFHYITNIIYPQFYKLFTPIGCDCTDGCLDSNKCFCAMRNGGEISYDSKGRIVKKKSLVYECGPSCKCSSSCMIRVSQLDGRFKLEIFKTELKGWGVRTLSYIPSGSFTCEYIGEILHDEEAKRRINRDNYQNGSLQEECSLIPWRSQSISVYGDYIIDATQSGNVGRFIKHSSSPNLFAQNVLYDHDDKRFPHIMLFASKDIPASRELTYDHHKERKTCERIN
ncbi:hypothetical protein ACJW31_03G124800 [Castanea mollissima]